MLSKDSTIRFSTKSEFFSVSLSNGFSVFSVNPLRKVVHQVISGHSFRNTISLDNSDISISSIPTEDSQTGNNVLCIFDSNLGKPVMLIERDDQIKNIFISELMFGFSTPTSVNIYTFNPPMIYYQYRTGINAYGPCDFIQMQGYYILGLSGRESGMLRIINSSRDDYSDVTIQGHSHPISIMKFNKNGSMIATASDIGTIVQLYDTRSGKLISKLRRGNLPTEITSLCFSPESDYLAIASAKGTVHVFSLLHISSSTVANPIRAEMKITFPDTNYLVINFFSRSLMHVATRKDLKTLKINALTNVITIKKEESYIDKL